MDVLLDTHVVLWWLAGDRRLSDRSRLVIEEGAGDVLVSAVSGFEIATKRKLGKLRAPDDLEAQLESAAISILPLTLRHGLLAGELPFHHRDPFDRLLVAQALTEHLTLLTADPKLAPYGAAILPA